MPRDALNRRFDPRVVVPPLGQLHPPCLPTDPVANPLYRSWDSALCPLAPVKLVLQALAFPCRRQLLLVEPRFVLPMPGSPRQRPTLLLIGIEIRVMCRHHIVLWPERHLLTPRQLHVEPRERPRRLPQEALVATGRGRPAHIRTQEAQSRLLPGIRQWSSARMETLVKDARDNPTARLTDNQATLVITRLLQNRLPKLALLFLGQAPCSRVRLQDARNLRAVCPHERPCRLPKEPVHTTKHPTQRRADASPRAQRRRCPTNGAKLILCQREASR